MKNDYFMRLKNFLLKIFIEKVNLPQEQKMTEDNYKKLLKLNW